MDERRACVRAGVGAGASARMIACVLAMSGALVACGGAISACGGASDAKRPAAASRDARPQGPRIIRRWNARDLLPGDLDIVARVDVARMRAQLGPEALAGVTRSVLAEAGVALVVEAFSRADVVWLGLRGIDLAAGDRVVVVEGPFPGFRPPPSVWTPVASDAEHVKAFQRIGDAPRSGTGRIFVHGDRLVAFVSPVEVDSVARILREGPDERRGDPAAEGIVSVDVRARRLPSALERRFPSIAAVVAGLERVRGTAVVVDQGLRIDGEIHARTAAGATRARKFLTLLRDHAGGDEKSPLGSMRIEPLERVVRVTCVVPASALIGEGTGAAGAEPPQPAQVK